MDGATIIVVVVGTSATAAAVVTGPRAVESVASGVVTAAVLVTVDVEAGFDATGTGVGVERIGDTAVDDDIIAVVVLLPEADVAAAVVVVGAVVVEVDWGRWVLLAGAAACDEAIDLIRDTFTGEGNGVGDVVVDVPVVVLVGGVVVDEPLVDPVGGGVVVVGGVGVEVLGGGVVAGGGALTTVVGMTPVTSLEY